MNGEHVGFLVETGIEALTFDRVVTGTYSGSGPASFFIPWEFSDNETEQITFFGKWTKGFSSGVPSGLYSVGSLTGHRVYQWGPADIYEGVYSGSIKTYYSATPEPSSLLMLGSGVLGVAGMIRRKLS
jgi:hypothetical protein